MSNPNDRLDDIEKECYLVQINSMPAKTDGSPFKVTILYYGNVVNIVTRGLREISSIHKKQIIRMEQTIENSVKGKSVIGRGVVGGVLLGPVGAVVGGLSGVGQKHQVIYVLHMVYTNSDNDVKELVFTSETPFNTLIVKIMGVPKIAGKITRKKTYKVNLPIRVVKLKKKTGDAFKVKRPIRIINKNRKRNAPIVTSAPQRKQNNVVKTDEKEIIKHLKDCKELLENGLITEDEFNVLKNRLFKNLSDD